MQVVCVVTRSGQESAKLVLIAEVEEDALEWREDVRRRRKVSAPPSTPALGPAHLLPQALTEGHVWVSVAARKHLPLGQLCP